MKRLDPSAPKLPRRKTDPVVAKAYAAKGWCGHKNRADWESSIRFKGAMKMPEKSA